MIRSATLQERPAFMRLWAEHLEEQEKDGSHLLATRGNLYRFLDYFESYIGGSLFGLCVVCEVDDDLVGVVLAGEFATPDNWETSLGKLGTLWGVYVIPPFRGRGIGVKLFARAKEMGVEMGFDTIETYIRVNNPQGKAVAAAAGTAVYIQQHLISLHDPKVLTNEAALKGLAREVSHG
jgi:ribosomal protein S18 acetylase RimI-like enzyme